MKIGIDISQIAYEGTGVARYVRMMVEAICTYDTENEYVFFFSSLRQNLQNDVEQKISQKHKIVKLKLPPTLLDIMWNRLHIVSINRLIETCDVFISSDWTQPPVSSTTKKVTIVHDLVYLKYPETVHPKIITAQKKRMEWVKKEVDMVIADSQSTKQDLIDLLEFEKEKIKVIYPAVEVQKISNFDMKKINNKYGIRNKKYILSVGKLEPRKNIPRLISAFQKANLNDTQLLIVGPAGWSDQMSKVKSQMSNVQFLGFVPDADLYELYSNALFFIYPSLYEGFGYPVIEAMALDCPVATSNTSSMKEIADDYGLLFNPESEDEIKDALVQLYKNENLRKELTEKSKKRIENFTQKKFVNQFLETIKAL